MKKIYVPLLLVFFVLRSFAETNVYPPTLVAPADAAVGRMPNVMLDWDAVAGAMSYKIELSADSAFTAPQQFTAAVTALNTSELMFGQEYWWRVKAMGITDSSDWSAVRTFTTIDVVNMVLPADSSMNHLVKMLVRWTALQGVTFYQWEVDSTLTFDSPLHRRGTSLAPSTQVYTSQLHFGQMYYIRIRAGHSKDTCSWSPERVFHTLSTFALRSPADHAVNQMPDVTLKWTWVNATYYDLAIAEDSAMTSPMYFTVDSSKATFINVWPQDTFVYSNSHILKFGTEYFWTVRGRNAHHTSDWVTPRSFTTVGEVTLISPADNAEDVPTATKFVWKSIDAVNNYVLYYDTDSAFATYTEVIMGTDTSYSVLSHLPGMTWFYWKVEAISDVDLTWSEERTFKTASGVGIEQANLSVENIRFYPNPSKGKLFLEISNATAGTLDVNVANILGQQVIANSFPVKSGYNTLTLNVDHLTSGIYLITCRDAHSKITRKFVIDK